MKDFSVILVRNENKKDNFLNKLLYSIIWHGSRSKYNHCQLIRSFNGQLYICESTITGFRVTKTLNRWKQEQTYMNRVFEVIDFEKDLLKDCRFNLVLGNKYNAQYWWYLIYYFELWLTGKEIWRGNTGINSTNCFQSVAYILGLENWESASGSKF